MKIYDAYRMGIEAGMARDLRPGSEVERILDDARAVYDSLPEDLKELYDEERLWNPYADSRFSVGAEKAKELDAERMMWGIDITSAEVLLADRLREKGQRIDAVIAHHPLGTSKTCFPEVMMQMTAMFSSMGVPEEKAYELVKERMEKVLRGMQGYNYNQAADAARMLDIPLFNIHAPADNMVEEFMVRKMKEDDPSTLQDIIDSLMKEPEARVAARCNSPPIILLGRPEDECGKIMVKMNGGTSFSKETYEALADAGVKTIIAMHYPDDHYETAQKAGINLIISGHMASDSIGVNLICDLWEKEGIEVIPCSGFTRFSRNRYDVEDRRCEHRRPGGPRAYVRVHVQQLQGLHEAVRCRAIGHRDDVRRWNTELRLQDGRVPGVRQELSDRSAAVRTCRRGHRRGRKDSD
jgi:putative NIF3 family GTP cyclohydrolase 1 type 2